jgi:hypothetical protein
MSVVNARWEPYCNAVHRLIQLLDVLAIAFNQYRQLSYKLHHRTDARVADDRERILGDYHGVTLAVFPKSDIAPHHTAARIGNAAVAELVRMGSKDEVAVREAQQWISTVGWILVPRLAPSEPESPMWKPFMEEGGHLMQYSPIRQQLLDALARCGWTVPDEIVRRANMAFCSLMHDGEDPVSQDTLLRWVRETEQKAMANELRQFAGDLEAGDYNFRRLEWQGKLNSDDPTFRLRRVAEHWDRARILRDRYDCKPLPDEPESIPNLAAERNAHNKLIAWANEEADRIDTPPTAEPISPKTVGGEKSEGGTLADSLLPAMLSASDIAKLIKRNPKSVSTFLTRYAKKHRDCRREIPTRRQNEPGFLYRTGDVWPALEQWMRENMAE